MTTPRARCQYHSDEVLNRPRWGVGEVVVTTKTLRVGKAVMLPGQECFVAEVKLTPSRCSHEPLLLIEHMATGAQELWWPEVLRRWERSDASREASHVV